VVPSINNKLYSKTMVTLIRMNAWTPKQWELILSKLNIPRQQRAGLWNIDSSDDKSDCES